MPSRTIDLSAAHSGSTERFRVDARKLVIRRVDAACTLIIERADEIALAAGERFTLQSDDCEDIGYVRVVNDAASAGQELELFWSKLLCMSEGKAEAADSGATSAAEYVWARLLPGTGTPVGAPGRDAFHPTADASGSADWADTSSPGATWSTGQYANGFRYGRCITTTGSGGNNRGESSYRRLRAPLRELLEPQTGTEKEPFLSTFGRFRAIDTVRGVLSPGTAGRRSRANWGIYFATGVDAATPVGVWFMALGGENLWRCMITRRRTTSTGGESPWTHVTEHNELTAFSADVFRRMEILLTVRDGLPLVQWLINGEVVSEYSGFISASFGYDTAAMDPCLSYGCAAESNVDAVEVRCHAGQGALILTSEAA